MPYPRLIIPPVDPAGDQVFPSELFDITEPSPTAIHKLPPKPSLP